MQREAACKLVTSGLFCSAVPKRVISHLEIEGSTGKKNHSR